MTELPQAGICFSSGEDRWCAKCERVCKGGEPDPCLGYIAGVSWACCGHGISTPYVTIGGRPGQSCMTFAHRSTLRGEFATAFFAIVAAARDAGRLEVPDAFRPTCSDEVCVP